MVYFHRIIDCKVCPWIWKGHDGCSSWHWWRQALRPQHWPKVFLQSEDGQKWKRIKEDAHIITHLSKTVSMGKLDRHRQTRAEGNEDGNPNDCKWWTIQGCSVALFLSLLRKFQTSKRRASPQTIFTYPYQQSNFPTAIGLYRKLAQDHFKLGWHLLRL